jgi:hypothetical protein
MSGGLLATWLGAEMFSSAQAAWIMIVSCAATVSGFVLGAAVFSRRGGQ